MALPTVDISLFTNGDSCGRRQAALTLLESLRQHGFVKVVGHGICEKTIGQLMEWSKSFFQMKDEAKVAIAHPGGSEPQRGWSAVGAENSATLYRRGLLKSRMVEDLKDAREHFDLGPTSDFQYPTRWPNENVLPGFKDFMEELFQRMESVAALLMEALEVGLGLPSGAFLERMTHAGNASEMRLNHYPAIDVGEIKGGRVSRIWPHFDLGVITLLFQDEVGGLEFEDRASNGNFQRVSCERSTEMVVNVSETLQRWTNGHVPAGLHRVNVPETLENQQYGEIPERYSIAYFCKADRDASVGPLKQFIHDGIDPLYEDISAIEYHRQRLLSAY